MIFRFCLIIDRIRKVHLIEHLNPNFTETLFKIFVIKLQKHEVVYTCTHLWILSLHVWCVHHICSTNQTFPEALSCTVHY